MSATFSLAEHDGRVDSFQSCKGLTPIRSGLRQLGERTLIDLPPGDPITFVRR